MSINSAREWRIYILTRGVFGNALKFSHFQDPGDVDRTPMGASSDATSDRSVRNRIRFFLMIVKPFLRRDPDQPERELLRYMDPKSENQHEAKYYNEGCSSCGHRRRISNFKVLGRLTSMWPDTKCFKIGQSGVFPACLAIKRSAITIFYTICHL